MKILEEIEMFFSGISNIIYDILYLGSAFMIVAPIFWLYDDYKLTGEVNNDKLSILLIKTPGIAVFIMTSRILKKRREKNKVMKTNDNDY